MQNSIFSFMELRMFKGVRNQITFSDSAFKSNPLENFLFVSYIFCFTNNIKECVSFFVQPFKDGKI